jgi:imidazolonepropionase-like amidohydrolase
MRSASAFRSLLLVSTLFSFTNCAVAQTADYAIAHVTVINPGSGKVQPDRTLVINRAAIVSVGPTKHTKLPASTKVIDGSGKFVIPGLWDMHTHFQDAPLDMKLYVANGVLGVRNMGAPASLVFPLRDAIAAGKQLGPKIVACGPIVDGPDSWVNPSFLISVKNPDEARAAVDLLKQQGTDCIKVYNNLSRDSYYAIIDEAKKLDIPVVGHLPNAISVREASNAGQQSLEHRLALQGGSTVEDELIKRSMDQSVFQEARSTGKFALIPAKIAVDETFMLDNFSQQRADETYRLLARNQTFITPTMVEEYAFTNIDDMDKQDEPRKQYVSAETLHWWKPENGMLTKYRTPEYIATRKRDYAKIMEEIPRAQKLGVHLLAGTDLTCPYIFPGFSLHDELRIFVEAGLTPMQALETATTNPALFLGLSKTWGQVEPGYTANLVLLNADPMADIANTENINAVVVNGVFLDRAKLDQLLSEARVSPAFAKPAK